MQERVNTDVLQSLAAAPLMLLWWWWCAGLRTREPKGLLSGLMWLNPDHPNALAHIRHLAQQHDGASACYDLRHDDHGNASRTRGWDWILVFMPCQSFGLDFIC